MQFFRHRMGRLIKRSTTYEPVTVGDEDGSTVITVYVNPFTDAAETFFDSVYDPLRNDYLSDTSDVAIEFRPVAPEMRLWSTATSADIRQIASGNKREDDQLSPGDFAEYLHAVREVAGEDDFLYAARRASLAADQTVLTYAKFSEFADGFEADVDAERLVKAVERGTYRGRVRSDSARWFDRLPGLLAETEDPREFILFVNGEPVRDIDPKVLRHTAESAKAVYRLDTATLDEV